MKNSLALKIFLFINGLIFSLAGSLALLAPVKFTIRNGIEIAGNLGLLNDYRSMGGLLVGGGLIILSGAFRSTLSFSAVLVAAVLGSFFSIGRLLSISLDGMPVEGLVKATMVETLLAVIALVMLFKFRQD